MDVKIPYTPRKLQRELHQSLKRFNVLVMHRRFGKTVFSINHLIRALLTSKQKNPRGYYICPLFSQAKATAWDYVREFTAVLPNVKYNETELRVELPNGARLQLLGGDNFLALKGRYVDEVVLDEFSQMNHKVWTEAIRPSMTDRANSRAIFIGTPVGHNQFHALYEFAQLEENDEWMAKLHKASETGIVDPKELLSAQNSMSPEEYQQEFECSFSAAIRGSYYGGLMDEAEEQGRITSVPYDPTMKVVTSWDLGINDSTVVWFWQIAPTEIRAIECIAFQSTGLPEIIKEVASRPYDYEQHIAPHDIAVRELGSGLSRKQIAAGLGVNFDVAPSQSVADGINAVRMLLPKVYFDKVKCKDGIEALKLYRTEFDDKRQTFRNNPLHDWTSDYTDSVRYFAITTKTTTKTPIKITFKGWTNK